MNKTQIQIRPATEDDLVNIGSCARAAYARYVERMQKEPAPMTADFASQIERDQVYVAMQGSLFTGYVVFYPEVDHLHLENVAVVPAHTGQGIGRKLIEHAEQAARNRGLATVQLYTNEVMSENLAMYPRLGYIEFERKQQDGFKRVFFYKSV